MKLIQSYKIPAVLLILILGFVFASEAGSPSSGAGEYSVLSILPPLFAILLALVTHEAHLSLFIGIWLGSTMVVQHPISGLTHALDTYIVQTVTDHGHASILIFTALYVLNISGGTIIDVVSDNKIKLLVNNKKVVFDSRDLKLVF